jgi:hypothetical protein
VLFVDQLAAKCYRSPTNFFVFMYCRPVTGGTAFVTTQAISWIIFSATVVMLVVLLQQLVAGVAHCFRCWALGAGTCMVMAQAVSITT